MDYPYFDIKRCQKAAPLAVSTPATVKNYRIGPQN